MSDVYGAEAAKGVGQSGVLRGAPEPVEQRRKLVAQLIKDVQAAKRKHEPAFKRMRADSKYVRTQRMEAGTNDDRALVNVTQRHVAAKTASLYAKNPTFSAVRKQRLEFAVWDGQAGTVQQLMQSMQSAAQVGMPPSPLDAQLLADIQQGLARKKMLESVGRTLEVVFDWALDEQNPPFKGRAKKVVRRTITMGVGYAKLGYQRQLAKRPDVEAKLADITDRLATIERMQADIVDKETTDGSADTEALRVAKAALDAEPDAVVREGLVIDWPHPTRVIPDTRCKELVGWVGATWVAEEFVMTVDEIQEVYGIDLKGKGSQFTGYQVRDQGVLKLSNSDEAMACVWEIYHRKHGVVYVVCDGYSDFLKEPAAPPVVVEQFIPIYPLVFNELEDEDSLFPPSDIEYVRPIQNEMNRKREALRQHRIASRPFYIGQRGKFEEADLKDIASVKAHDIVFTNALDAQERLDMVVQRFPSANVDPNLYETASDVSDMTMVIGAQEASLGTTAGGGVTATESSIAETSRVASVASNVDDLDAFLASLCRDGGGVLLRNLTRETVQKIAGPGAVWPELSPQDIVEEVYLDVQAGSSGRPNKDQELANLERTTPMLVQLPGLDPSWLARYTLRTLDSRIDLEEALVSGLPSILTLNATAQAKAQAQGPAQVPTGDPATDPAQQGGQGTSNAAGPAQSEGGPQAGFPAPNSAQPNQLAGTV